MDGGGRIEQIVSWKKFTLAAIPYFQQSCFLGPVYCLIAFLVSSLENTLYAAIGIAVSYPVYRLVKKLMKAIAVSTD